MALSSLVVSTFAAGLALVALGLVAAFFAAGLRGARFGFSVAVGVSAFSANSLLEGQSPIGKGFSSVLKV